MYDNWDKPIILRPGCTTSLLQGMQYMYMIDVTKTVQYAVSSTTPLPCAPQEFQLQPDCQPCVQTRDIGYSARAHWIVQADKSPVEDGIGAAAWPVVIFFVPQCQRPWVQGCRRGGYQMRWDCRHSLRPARLTDSTCAKDRTRLLDCALDGQVASRRILAIGLCKFYGGGVGAAVGRSAGAQGSQVAPNRLQMHTYRGVRGAHVRSESEVVARGRTPHHNLEVI